jgi:DNA-directed RNA polymerase specialized sigma24 family protein
MTSLDGLFSPAFLAEFVLPSVDVGETCLGSWGSRAGTLETIETFLNRVARRAIVDLHRSGKYSAELAAMWWRTGSDDPAALRAHCNEVSVMNEGVSSPMCGQ